MKACQIIVNAVGYEKATEIFKELGGQEVYLPKRITKEIIKPIVDEMLKKMTYREVSRKLDMPEKTIRAYHREIKLKKMTFK